MIIHLIVDVSVGVNVTGRLLQRRGCCFIFVDGAPGDSYTLHCYVGKNINFIFICSPGTIVIQREAGVDLRRDIAGDGLCYVDPEVD